MSNFTREERFEIIEKSMAAAKAGNDEEAMRIGQLLPLAPHLAKAAKEIWGREYLLQNGWDLSEAEATYGKDWLNQ